MKLTPFIKNLLISMPFYFLTIVPLFVIANFMHLTINPGYIALGAAGWWIALLLRLPVVALLKLFKTNDPLSPKIIIGSSGPTEEIVRLCILIILGFTSGNALSIAIGWAGIEIIYALIQNMAMAALDQKTDEKALKAKKLLAQQGMDQSMQSSAPFWGILERLSANGLHLSFTLLLVVSPWLILITIPLHSACNYIVTVLLKSSLAKAEIALLGTSLALTATSIYLV